MGISTFVQLGQDPNLLQPEVGSSAKKLMIIGYQKRIVLLYRARHKG
jgi:hypothetical protein